MYCAARIVAGDFTGVGTYEAVISGPVNQRKLFQTVSACNIGHDAALYATRRPYDTDFYMATTLGQYNQKISEGYTEQYGVIGKTQDIVRFNGYGSSGKNQITRCCSHSLNYVYILTFDHDQ